MAERNNKHENVRLPCSEIHQAISWILDDEVDLQELHDFEDHLRECTECSALLAREERLRRVVKRAGQSVVAPASLRSSVSRAVYSDQKQKRSFRQWAPAAMAAAILLSFAWKGMSPDVSDDVRTVMASHIQGLPLDFADADVGKMKHFFETRLPFAVNLPRFATKLPVKAEGARIIRVQNRDAAYIRLNSPRGRLSFFVYQAPHLSVEHRAPLYKVGEHRKMLIKHIKGYTVAKWQSAGLTYSLVGDMSAPELTALLDPSLR
ncbi:hypothetical protein KAI87_01750 [Myxococcota bacterium]|nr:hypothetical protein [Myxococcota bacterium]